MEQTQRTDNAFALAPTNGSSRGGDGLEEAYGAAQYLTFSLRNEEFGIQIGHIREIIEYTPVTTVPMMPDFLMGVINLRGKVVPVIDLLVRFGREKTAVGKRSCIVIVQIEHDEEHQELGIVVDSVNEVLDIEPAQQERPPAFGSGLRREFISGIGKVEDHFIVILAIEKVLSVTELAELSASLVGADDATDSPKNV